MMIGDKPSFNLDDYSDEDDIPDLSVEGNWYKIKKKELILNNLLDLYSNKYNLALYQEIIIFGGMMNRFSCYWLE